MASTYTKNIASMKDFGVEWIGEIPEGWEVVPAYVHLKETKRKNIGLQEENVLSLSYGNIISKNVAENMGLIPASYETYQIVESGQIVFRLTDLQNDKRSLRNGLVRERGIITSAYTAVRAKKGCLPSYFNYLFRAYDTTKVLYTLGSGVRQSSDYSELKRLPVVVPPTETQKRIVDFLDRKTAQVDAVIEKKKRMIELLKEKRTSIITHAVTKGLDPNTTMKDSGVEWIGEIPEGWGVKRARFVFSEISKRNCPDADLLSVYREYGVVPTSSRDDNHNVPSDDLSNYKHVRVGDLVFNKMKTWQGSIAISDYQGIVSPAYYVAGLVSESEICRKYVHYLLRSKVFISKYRSISTGIRPGQWDMSFDLFKDVHVLIPPFSEQEEIARYIHDKIHQTDHILEALSEQINKLTEYRNSLIYHAVSGKMNM